MKERRQAWRILLGVAGLMALLGVLGFIVYRQLPEPESPSMRLVRRLQPPEGGEYQRSAQAESIRALRLLLEENHINELVVSPSDKMVWQTSQVLDMSQCQGRIYCFDAADASGRFYRAAYLLYYASDTKENLRTKTYAFVFDREGRCVFHSRDDHWDRHTGLGDITGDGQIEKIVNYPGHDKYHEVVCVFRLGGAKPELLFEAEFPNEFIDSGPGYSFDALPTEPGLPWRIEFDETHGGSVIELIWIDGKYALKPSNPPGFIPVKTPGGR